MNQKRVVQGPHLRAPKRTSVVMRDVALSLLPALAGAVYFFGIRALWMTLLSVAVCVAAEYLWQKLSGKQVTSFDFSAVVTGMLLAFNMPVTVPFWVLAAACVFSIIFVKQMFGGIGSNFVNPALMGRLFVMAVWPGMVVQYTAPVTADTMSSATILGTIKAGAEVEYSYFQMLIGEIPGAIGETGKLFLLAGFLYMCWRGIVNIEASLTYIATVLVLTFVFGPEGMFTGDILANLLGGGLLLGGFYMLTDYVFVSRKGRILYAVAAGVITAGVRIFSTYPEGVCLGILTANCLAGCMAVFYKKHVYGIVNTRKGEKG